MTGAPTTRADEGNRELFNAAAVVDEYATNDGLTAPEAALFERHLQPGMDILDLGVGGGRTLPALRALAHRYVGVDYAQAMIEACRRRFPDAELFVGDASDLSRFDDGSFDAVVFSFNGIDCLTPDAARLRCLRECARVLRQGGVFILSRHDPAGFVSAPRGARRSPRAWARAGAASARRLLRVARRALWRGDGYVLDPIHGGMLTNVATPRRVRDELRAAGFEHLETLPSSYPKRRPRPFVPWRYYAFRRAVA